MASKKMPSNSKLEKREEKLHKDLDHDGEKGESAAHKAKVLGKKNPFGGKQAAPFGKSGKAMKSGSKAMKGKC